MDRYFYRGAPGGPAFVSPSTGKSLPDCNHPDSADNARLLAELHARRQDDAPDVLIVEGLMALHVPEIRQRLDLRLFVELDADERALRRLLRNLGRGTPTRPASSRTTWSAPGSATRATWSRRAVHADLMGATPTSRARRPWSPP